MAETCIVCLGDLGVAESDSASNGGPEDAGAAVASTASSELSPQLADPAAPPELIAHLLPCGHNLHDDCLKPWVERANSCPICRQNFNLVELSKVIGGPVSKSYRVEDRTQVAEVDPSMLIEELDDPDSQPCPICKSDDNEDVLLLCDGCDAAYHTYCVDLDSVPVGAWFCDDCATARAIEPTIEVLRNNHLHNAETRTRALRRQYRNRNQATSSNWARVWQTVWDRLNIDLDFPFDDNASAAQYQRSQRLDTRTRPAYRAWERRLQVAQQQGGQNRFQETAGALLDRPTISRPRPQAPEPESVEELLAWNALEKARDIESDPTPKSRKRKSATTSPSEADRHPRKRKRRSPTSSPSGSMPAPMPERRLKRPQTRRAQDDVDCASDSIGESSSSRRKPSASHLNGHNGDLANGAPSFLQSLLDEVESSAVVEDGYPQRSSLMLNTLVSSDHPSPHHSSPAASPTVSNHPSPRALSATPPPHSNGPGSPIPLTSKVEPIYPPAPEFSDPATSPDAPPRRSNRISKSQSRVSRWVTESAQHSSSPPTRHRSEETSPSRANLSLSAKESVQKLVKEALKTPYQQKQVSKDQYTEINKNISRLLYDRVGDDANINEETNEKFRRMAVDEVTKALQALGEGSKSPTKESS